MGAEAARMLNDQILGLVRQAVFTTGTVFADVFVKSTGDGAILDFPEPQEADRFAEALHQLSDQQHNQKARQARQEMKQRSFRVGIFSGKIDRTPDDVAGLPVVYAARLEAAAAPGQIVIDKQSWEHLREKQQNAYGELEVISGKDDALRTEVRRRQVVPPATWGQVDTDDREDSRPSGQLSANEERLLTDVFDTLRLNSIVLLLAQDGHADRAVLEQIQKRAGVQRQTLRVTLLASLEPEMGRFFASIARQCGFDEEVRDSIDWEDALDNRLRNGESLFLLIDGFERGSEAGRQQLGTILRALSEIHGRQFSAVLLGGEQLAALKYQPGYTSMLSSATRLDWPEPDAEDVLAWQQREYPEQNLSRAEAEDILKLCGGHPRLVRHLLDRRGRGEPEREAGCAPPNEGLVARPLDWPPLYGARRFSSQVDTDG